MEMQIQQQAASIKPQQNAGGYLRCLGCQSIYNFLENALYCVSLEYLCTRDTLLVLYEILQHYTLAVVIITFLTHLQNQSDNLLPTASTYGQLLELFIVFVCVKLLCTRHHTLNDRVNTISTSPLLI